MKSGFHGDGLLCEGKGEAWEGMKSGGECGWRGRMARGLEGRSASGVEMGEVEGANAGLRGQ